MPDSLLSQRESARPDSSDVTSEQKDANLTADFHSGSTLFDRLQNLRDSDLPEAFQSDELIAEKLNKISLPEEAKRLTLVTVDKWSSISGTMRLFERGENNSWVPTGDRWPINIGERGMGWGRGLISNDIGPNDYSAGPKINPGEKCAETGNTRCEGGMKAPAGVFKLGLAFGRPENVETKLPYVQITENHVWADTPEHYNTLVDLDPQTKTSKGDPSGVKVDGENMFRKKDWLYDLGIEIKQNTDPPVLGAGSGIFLHLQRRPGSGSAGCTTMSEANMRRLLSFADERSTLLLQAPIKSLDELDKAVIRRM